jgi:hypothetical protein
VLDNDDGKLQAVSTEALTQLFGASEISEVECVLLNACYSQVQAIAIHPDCRLCDWDAISRLETRLPFYLLRDSMMR